MLQLPPAPAVPTRAVCQEYERLRKAINVLYMLQKKVQQKEAELAGLREHPGADGRLAEGKVRTTCGRDGSWAVCFQGCKHGTEMVSVAARTNLPIQALPNEVAVVYRFFAHSSACPPMTHVRKTDSVDPGHSRQSDTSVDMAGSLIAPV